MGPRLSVLSHLDAWGRRMVLASASVQSCRGYGTGRGESGRDKRLGHHWGDRPGAGLGDGCCGRRRDGPRAGRAGRGWSRSRVRLRGGGAGYQRGRDGRGLGAGLVRGQAGRERGGGCDGLLVGGRGDVGNHVRGHGGDGHRDGQRDEDPDAGVNAGQRAGCRSSLCSRASDGRPDRRAPRIADPD